MADTPVPDLEITMRRAGAIVTLDGVPCRLWLGTTAGGIDVLCYVHRVAVRDSASAAEPERALAEVTPPALIDPPPRDPRGG